MKSILILLFASSTPILLAQTKQFKSSTTYTINQTKTTQSIQRDVIVNNESITITKLLNNGTEDAKLKIERIEKKKYLLIPSTWYYCLDTKETISLEEPKMIHKKAIVIIPDPDFKSGFINLFFFENEVLVFQTVFDY